MGDLIKTIHHGIVPSPIGCMNQSIKLSSPEYVASFTWLNDPNEPTMFVPGTPARWTWPARGPLTMSDEDKHNTKFFVQDFPLEPAVRAIHKLDALSQSFDVDLVACSDVLESILLFCTLRERTFHLSVEIIGSTAFFVRREYGPKSSTSDLELNNIDFLSACTTWDDPFQGCTSHQRICRYNLGDLRCLVQSEVDGYGPEEHGPGAAILDRERSLHSSTPSKLEEPSVITPLNIKMAGDVPSQERLFAFKTYSADSNIKPEDFYPHLWIKCVQNLAIALHKDGEFAGIDGDNVFERIDTWERDNADAIRHFYATIQEIIKVAACSPNRKIEVVRHGTGSLQVRKLAYEQWSALPRDLKQKWSQDTRKPLFWIQQRWRGLSGSMWGDNGATRRPA